MRVALVHDWLVRMRGGERCLEALLAIYPDADVFTLVHSPGAVSPAIERRIKASSAINRLPGVRAYYPYLLPLFPTAIERLDLRGYDLVLSISHCVAKGVRTLGTRHLCYCLTPMRYVWDLYDAYFGDGRAPPFVRAAMRRLAPRLRRWDVGACARVDRFVAISGHIANRIRRIYDRSATVVYPPVAIERFAATHQREDFYLSVSALVPYKRLDIAVDAFTRSGRTLIVVGEGAEYRRLRARAGRNVTFTGWISDREVADLMARCRAFVHTAEEDFGIALVEAQAAGAPVIAYGVGGSREIVRALGDPPRGERPTGVLFPEQRAYSLADAVRLFETLEFDAADAIANAARFSVSAFQTAIRREISACLDAVPGHVPAV